MFGLSVLHKNVTIWRTAIISRFFSINSRSLLVCISMENIKALWFHYYSPKCQKKICLDKCFVNHLETFLWWFWAQINWFTKNISIFGSARAFFVFLGFSGVSQGKMVIIALISPVNHPKSLLGGPWWVSRGFWVIYAKKKGGGAFWGQFWGKMVILGKKVFLAI